METLKHYYSIIWEVIKGFWSFQLYKVGGDSITIGALITGIILLLFVYGWSKKISQKISDNILTRFDIDESARSSISKIFFYVLLVVFTLFVLRLLNVPVTIFTVLGGGLALGFGLGAQKLLNNFISGIVLMLERPIKIGDMINVDGQQGVVEEIGSRATWIKTIDNTHIVVPNSTFLETNVLNWTISDNVVRSSIKVGVAYGSPVDEVESILKKLAVKHEKILSFPEPVVLFKDFGDSSLTFELSFHCQIKSFLMLQQICSKLRFMIDDAFRSNNIVIAFPQRDVHFHPTQPISVIIENK